METAAHLSNIITAVIAVVASLIGGIWWLSVRQRRSQMVREDLVDIMDRVEGMSKVHNQVLAMLENNEIPESEKSAAVSMLIDIRIHNVYFLFFLHFVHSNLRPHEIPDFLKQWKFKSPVQWPMERKDAAPPTSGEEK